MGNQKYRNLFERLDGPKENTKSAKCCKERSISMPRHYPGEYHMEEARKAAPEVFGDWEDMKHD